MQPSVTDEGVRPPVGGYREDVIAWRDGAVRFIDQTLLPGEYRVVETRDWREVVEAIRSLQLRGAPLIGVAAAYGTALAAHTTGDDGFPTTMNDVLAAFAASRPTAVNLFWSLERMRSVLQTAASPAEARTALLAEARHIHDDDAARCAAIGAHGLALVPAGARIITHCNTGALATGGDGTAFSVLLAAHRAGRGIHVYADETRPLLQGARLTMWELAAHGIDATLITDGTAPMLVAQGGIALAITGADRIAANGDSANKIGTYGLALACRAHRIPFYIAAPLSTIDMTTPDGAAIPIEERGADEVRSFMGVASAPAGARVYAPAFDVTPGALISGIVTERGILTPPYPETLAALFA
jgi:methylthioribose-1-phosphate isomerase